MPQVAVVMLIGIVGVLFAAVTSGVLTDGADQRLYIPYLRHAANPALYAHDFIFQSDNYRSTVFVPVFGWLFRITHLSMPTFMLVGQVLSLWLWFSGLAAVATKIGGPRAALWCVLFCGWPLPVPGCAMNLWESALHPRTPAMGLGLVALALLLRRRWLASALLAAAAFLLHPLLGLGVIAGLALASTAYGRRDGVRFVALVLVTLLVSRLLWKSPPPQLGLLPEAWWLKVASRAYVYLWFQSWTASIAISFVVWLLLASLAWWGLREHPLIEPRALARIEPRALARIELRALGRFGLAALPLLVVALLGMALQSPLLVSLQIHRSFLVFQLAMIVLVATLLHRRVEANALPFALFALTALVSASQMLFVVAPVLLCVGTMALAPFAVTRLRVLQLGLALAIVPLVVYGRVHAARLEKPIDPERGDWVALQAWAQASTPIDTMFVTPIFDPPAFARMPDFREYSERSTVLGRNDGVPGLFNRELADACEARKPVADAYAAKDCRALDAQAKRFSASLLVTDFACPALREVHREGVFVVYAAGD